MTTALANNTAAISSTARGTFKPISPRNLRVQENEGVGGQVYKTCVVFMPDYVTLDDLNARAEMWSLVQEGPCPLNEDDKLEMRWRDGMRVYGVVDYVEAGKVYLFDIRKPTRRKPIDVDWTDGKFIVRRTDGGFAYFRIAGDGGQDLRLGSGTWPTADAAKQACVANEYPRKIR